MAMIRKNSHRVFISGLLLVFFLLSGCARNPVTGQQDFILMSEEEEIQTGKKFYPKMTQFNNGELPGKNLQTYVNRLGQQLGDVSHNPDLPYKFNVVNSSTPNAYALPGGFISITRGLLLEMDREAQLAGVLGHEIVHATARHSAQQQTQGLFANLLLTAGSIYLQAEGVEYGGLYQDLGRLGAQAYLASYSRSQEAQADRVGMRYAAKAGYDPAGMIELQQILLRLRQQEPNVVQQIFSTHPLSEQRIEDAKEQLKEINAGIDRPTQKQLNQFDSIVERTWKPRKPAYNHMDTGVKHLQKDRINEAIKSFRTARDLYDGDPIIHAWLGEALTEADRLDEGRDALDRALSIKNDIFRVRLFSGVNYFELDQYDKSLSELNEADKLLDGMPDVFFYKGRNYEAKGDRNKAANFYIEYLKRVQKGENAAYARKKLRQWGYI